MSRADAVALPKGKGYARYLFFRRAQVQKVARALRDEPAFNWQGFGQTYANELLYLPSGRYLWADETVIPWGSPCAAAALTHGRNAPFASMGDVPAAVLAAVEAGVAKAIALRAHVIEDGLIIGRRLGLKESMRRTLRAWLLWPENMSQAEFDARHEERRAKATALKREKRRAAGMKPRADYEAGSIAAMARALGIKPDTLRARLRRAAPVTPPVASVSTADNRETSAADRPATERYSTIAEQARAQGLSPGTLRVRLHRERERRARREMEREAARSPLLRTVDRKPAGPADSYGHPPAEQ